METMERDPVYIAEQVKFIRKMHKLTQENLAEAAGLTTRTIEKIESGRHRPDEQTLRSIGRALRSKVRGKVGAIAGLPPILDMARRPTTAIAVFLPISLSATPRRPRMDWV